MSRSHRSRLTEYDKNEGNQEYIRCTQTATSNILCHTHDMAGRDKKTITGTSLYATKQIEDGILDWENEVDDMFDDELSFMDDWCDSVDHAVYCSLMMR